MLSFDEFRAINARKRQGEKIEDKQTEITSKSNEKNEGKSSLSSTSLSSSTSTASSSSSVSSSSSFGLGNFLEMSEMQVVVIVLIIFDSFASFLQVSLLSEGESSANLELTMKLLKSFTTFTVFFFALEIIALLISFRLKLLGHLGYLIDILVVGFELSEAIKGTGIQYRVLNILRFWRLIRLFQSLVNLERDAHNDTLKLLEGIQLKKQFLEEKIQLLTDDLRKEQEARVSIEDILQNYKEEVDTLNEALKIAAMDIAEVAEADDEDFLSDEDDGVEGDRGDDDDDEMKSIPSRREGDAEIKSDTLSLATASEHSHKEVKSGKGKGNRKEDIYREVLKEGQTKGQAPNPSRSTFVIQEDGTFQRK
jgi:hypothetical protein